MDNKIEKTTLDNYVSGSFVVGYDINLGTHAGVVIVGQKMPNETIKIINAFQVEDAEEFYKKQIAKKEKSND